MRTPPSGRAALRHHSGAAPRHAPSRCAARLIAAEPARGVRAEHVFVRGRLQPAAQLVGRRLGHADGGASRAAPRDAHPSRRPRRTATPWRRRAMSRAITLCRAPHCCRTRARRARSSCLKSRPPSTSRSTRGTSARSWTWKCVSRRAPRCTPLPAAAPHRDTIAAPRSVTRHHAAPRASLLPNPRAACAQGMFFQATAFNQPLNSWDVSSVTNMEVRRAPRPAMRTPPGGGDALRHHSGAAPRHHATPRTSVLPNPRAACAQYMFYNAAAFNQPLNSWDVGSGTYMEVRRTLRPRCTFPPCDRAALRRALWSPRALRPALLVAPRASALTPAPGVHTGHVLRHHLPERLQQGRHRRFICHQSTMDYKCDGRH